MALTPTQTSLCNSMSQQFDGLIAPILAAKSQYQKTMRDLDATLRSTSFSPQSAIDGELNDLKNKVKSNMPGSDLGAMEELKDLIENCEYLDALSPAAALIGATGGLFDKIGSLVDNSGVSIPEFGLASLADQLKKLMSGVGIPGGSVLKELFEKADKLINCLDALCGYDVTNKINTLNQLVEDYGLTDQFDIDFDNMFSNAGLSTTEIDGLNTAFTGVDDINTDAIGSINDAVSSVKSLTKSGGFF